MTGYLGLFGATKTVYTHLVQNARAEDKFIFVESAENWEVGDELLIASSSYDQDEIDTCKISSVEKIELDENLMGDDQWDEASERSKKGRNIDGKSSQVV